MTSQSADFSVCHIRHTFVKLSLLLWKLRLHFEFDM